MNTENKSQLGTASIGSLMLRLAVPSILAQIINILYNIIDRIYIGHIQQAATLALTGVGVCYPIVTLIAAFSLFAGAGGAPLAAIELGKAETDEGAYCRAKKILGNATFLLLCFSAILMAFFFAFCEPVLFAFGASRDTMPFAKNYLQIYLCGTLFVQLTMGLNAFITAQGKSKIAMFSILIGAVLNIVLDPLFIFVLNLGVKGAAIATVISQFCSCMWVVLFLCSKKSEIKLSFKALKPEGKCLARIAALGVSPFVMSSTESAIFIVFNSGLQRYGGDQYVAAMTILQSLMSVCFVCASGFTDGVYPIISYNYGAKKIERVKRAIRLMLASSFVLLLVPGCLVGAFPGICARLFTSDEEIIKVIAEVGPVYLGAVWLFGVQCAAQRTFVALEKAKTSILVACLRKLILLIPLALILPHFIGVRGIFLAEPIASYTSEITSLILLYYWYKKL